MFKINNYEFESNNNLILAHFSDIHFAKQFNKKKLDIVLDDMKKLKPDYICITGDIVDDISVTKNEKIKELFSFLKCLSRISKVIVGLGNHDTRENDKWYLNLKDIVVLLDNDYYEDEQICFYGLTMDNDYYKQEEKNAKFLLERIKKIEVSKKYNVLIFHSPINFDSKEIGEINKFDLVLTGHTHNGIMPHFVPGNMGIISPDKKLFPKNVRNSFKSGNSKVIISGGITKLSVKAGIFHLFNPFLASDLNYIYLKKR